VFPDSSVYACAERLMRENAVPKRMAVIFFIENEWEIKIYNIKYNYNVN
jgi:hypothetical protein